MEFLQPFLPDFPKDIQTVRAILQKLWSGQIFTSVRCKAAGLTASDKCFACREHEDHLHLFKQCPFYAQTRPPDVCQRSSWCTGIVPRSQMIGPKNKSLPVLPPEMFCARTSDPVFIDVGLCKQIAATSDCCVGFLVSFSWVEGASPRMWPKLSESWDLCPFVLLGLF